MSFDAALLQLTVTDDPLATLPHTCALVRQAAEEGAALVLTPEVTNCITTSRANRETVLHPEATDPTLAALREEAARAGVWLLIGSLALRTDDVDGRLANRSFLVGPDGDVVARYDKIHMFDVQVTETETYRESATFRPGDQAVVAHTPLGSIGLTVCYDVRFPHLHRMLAHAGAEILTIPAAFSPVTGAAHWETLLRARAIETGCYVLAPAQTGRHSPKRSTHGHSMAVAPWGDVLADGGTAPGITHVEIDLARVAEARGKVPSLSHDRPITPPTA